MQTLNGNVNLLVGTISVSSGMVLSLLTGDAGHISTSPYRKALLMQGDSGGICNTLGNDSMCDSKEKSSYEHGSDFERLPRL
jgi:hypothetical protein